MTAGKKALSAATGKLVRQMTNPVDEQNHYARLASEARQALLALQPEQGKRRGLRSRKLKTMLRHRKHILDKLHQGELNPEQALVLLMENEKVVGPKTEVTDYLNKVSGALKDLDLKLPEGGSLE